MMTGKLVNISSICTISSAAFAAATPSQRSGSTLFGVWPASPTPLHCAAVPWQIRMISAPLWRPSPRLRPSIFYPAIDPLILYSLVSNARRRLVSPASYPDLARLGSALSVTSRDCAIPYEKAPVRWNQMAHRGLYSMPALIMPVLVLMALRFGVLTPTEISTSAVVYAMLVSAFFYRDLTWVRVAKSVRTAGIATGVVMLLIMASTASGWILTMEQVPERFRLGQGPLHHPRLHPIPDELIMLVAGCSSTVRGILLPPVHPAGQVLRHHLVQLVW
jgi:hypothetical protein